MDPQILKNYYNLYFDELHNSVLPFWMKNSIDTKNGGFFSCLSRQGEVYDTDKFIWLQARQVWTFSKLYNDLKQNEEFLEIAIHGALFLEKYGRDEHGNWYFSLDQKGDPLVVPYNIFSDCFACMAFGQLYKATKNERYKKITLDTFQNILQRRSNPKGKYNKNIGQSRNLKNFALPMILANLSMEIKELLDPQLLEALQTECVKLIMEEFYSREFGLILENVNQDGSFSDTFDGRLINPGHGLEAMWFIMDIAVERNDQELIKHCGEISLNILEHSWDDKHGGLYYFMDIKGHPTQQLEWNQKLWWVHLEATISTLKAYKYTGKAVYGEWFEILHNYQWNHFRDPDYGEWFGYLNRNGSPLHDLKGGKWKGCFHVPRSLFIISNLLKEI